MDLHEEARHAQFRSELERLVGKAPHGVIRRCFVVDVAAAEPRWTETEIELSPGDWVTILAVGRIAVPDDRSYPRTELRMRVGSDGTILRGSGPTHSFLAFEAGALQLATADPRGDEAGVAAADVDGQPNGYLSIGVLLWSGPTLRGLKQIAGPGVLGELIAAEIDRIRNAEPPEGWQYDRLLGSSER